RVRADDVRRVPVPARAAATPAASTPATPAAPATGTTGKTGRQCAIGRGQGLALCATDDLDLYRFSRPGRAQHVHQVLVVLDGFVAHLLDDVIRLQSGGRSRGPLVHDAELGALVVAGVASLEAQSSAGGRRGTGLA